MKTIGLHLSFSVILLLKTVYSLETVSSDIVVKNVDRQVDISSQLTKIASKLTIENSGKSTLKSFLFSVEPQFKKLVAFVGAQVFMNP